MSNLVCRQVIARHSTARQLNGSTFNRTTLKRYPIIASLCHHVCSVYIIKCPSWPQRRGHSCNALNHTTIGTRVTVYRVNRRDIVVFEMDATFGISTKGKKHWYIVI